MLKALKCTERARWPLNVVLVNARVGPHIDKHDSSWALVGMTVTGDFRNGGDIVCPQLERQFMLRKGGVLFLVARVIHHFVSHYTGERISHIHAMHENLFNQGHAENLSKHALERKRKREAKEPTNALDDSRVFVLCGFCQKRCAGIRGLKGHLRPWRMETLKPEDKVHKVDAIRAMATERGWKAVK